MEEEIKKVRKTMTAGELIKVLKDYPKDWKIYLASDEEGNSFGTLHNQSIGYSTPDGALLLYPWKEYLDFEEICPKLYKEMQ